jgi:hypothetical protein
MRKNKTYNKKVKPISQNVAISKLFFFPSWKCGDFVFFFLENFQNARFTMYVFMGDFSTDFRHKK